MNLANNILVMTEKKERLDNPIISVIVPVYNVENYLATLLESLLNQSEKSIEIITIDDGSTDSSSQILQDYVDKDPRLVLISQQNCGLSCARNTGLKHAKGKWIAFADSDDWVHPLALETWLKQAQEYNLDFLLGNRFRFTNDPLTEIGSNNILLEKTPWEKIVTGKEWMMHCLKSEDRWPHAVWIQFLKHDLIKNNNLQFKKGVIHEDMLWSFNLALCAQRVWYCPSPFYGYRIRPDSITNTGSQKKLILQANSLIDIFDEILISATKCNEILIKRAATRLIIRHLERFIHILTKSIESHEERSIIAKRAQKLKITFRTLIYVTNYRELKQIIRWSIILFNSACLNSPRRQCAQKEY